MVDHYDDETDHGGKNPLTPLNSTKIPKRQVAVAIKDAVSAAHLPTITAAGRGKIAEQILQLAFENGIKVREDGALAEILAKIELDSPIPSEALMAVAEIMSYVYRANGEPNPFNAVLQDVINNENNPPQDDDDQNNP